MDHYFVSGSVFFWVSKTWDFGVMVGGARFFGVERGVLFW